MWTLPERVYLVSGGSNTGVSVAGSFAPRLTKVSVSFNLPLVQTYDAVLEALADPTRREIVERLRRAPSAVSALAETIPVTRPAISQHLKVLREVGLVDFDRAGTRNVYRLRPEGLGPLREWLEDFWQDALDAFAAYANQQGPGGTNA